MDSIHKVIARIAGAILLVFGVGLITVSVLAGTARLSVTGQMSQTDFIFPVALFGLGLLLGWMGFRLAANRPNRYGSVLPPLAWYAMSISLIALCGATLVASVWKRNSTLLALSFLTGLMAWWYWTAAKNAVNGNVAEVGAAEAMLVAGRPRKEYFHLLNIRGVPISIHPSLPLGGAMFAVYAGFDTGSVLYYCLGYFVLIGLHEAGHAIAARAVGLKVLAIHLSGAGGACHVLPPRNAWHMAIVFSAGLIVQLLLLIATAIYLAVNGAPTSAFGKSMVATFTMANGIVLFLNVLPRHTSGGMATDGAVLWQVLGYAFQRKPLPFQGLVPVPAEQSPVFPPDTKLLSIPKLVPHGFKHGVEILNDKTTPMQFVVDCLTKHVCLSQVEALRATISIHNNGGILIPLPSRERAEEVATAMMAENSESGASLACRAVDATVRASQ